MTRERLEEARDLTGSPGAGRRSGRVRGRGGLRCRGGGAAHRRGAPEQASTSTRPGDSAGARAVRRDEIAQLIRCRARATRCCTTPSGQEQNRPRPGNAPLRLRGLARLGGRPGGGPHRPRRRAPPQAPEARAPSPRARGEPLPRAPRAPAVPPPPAQAGRRPPQTPCPRRRRAAPAREGAPRPARPRHRQRIELREEQLLRPARHVRERHRGGAQGGLPSPVQKSRLAGGRLDDLQAQVRSHDVSSA